MHKGCPFYYHLHMRTTENISKSETFLGALKYIHTVNQQGFMYFVYICTVHITTPDKATATTNYSNTLLCLPKSSVCPLKIPSNLGSVYQQMNTAELSSKINKEITVLIEDFQKCFHFQDQKTLRLLRDCKQGI